MVTFGAPHVLDLVARVANHAMKAAWYHKWLVHRRFRPEEAAGRIHNHLTGAADYPLRPKLTDSAALAALYSHNGTYLCPQAYPEGCPAHPAYPGAMATIGGAGASVLKAFFNEAWVIPNPVVPSDDGLSLQPWKDEPLTVGGELNKLAFNMACGRDTAGVHFRRDEIDGVFLGEGAAFSVITDVNTTYNEGFDGFRLTSFDGTPTTIRPAIPGPAITQPTRPGAHANWQANGANVAEGSSNWRFRRVGSTSHRVPMTPRGSP